MKRMSELINLRQARKARARSEAERKAAEKRAAHGRSKSEKQLARAETERRRGQLDGAKREKDPLSE